MAAHEARARASESGRMGLIGGRRSGFGGRGVGALLLRDSGAVERSRRRRSEAVRQGASVVGSLGSTVSDKLVGGTHAPTGGDPSWGVDGVVEVTAGGVVPTTPSLEVDDALVASRRQRGRRCSEARTSVRVEGQGSKHWSVGCEPASSGAVGRLGFLLTTSRLQRPGRDVLSASGRRRFGADGTTQTRRARRPIIVIGGQLDEPKRCSE